jgi:ribosomal-protein-alanine N-acetyltransferase
MIIPPTDAWSADRVELFALSVQDVTSEYVSWLNDPVVTQYSESRFAVHTMDSTQAFVEACRSRQSSILWGIRVLGTEHKHVGNVKLDAISAVHRTAEVGILIGDRRAWGQGIATRVLEVVAGIAKDELALRKLTAGCYEDNVASIKAFERAGFVQCGRRIAQFALGEGFQDNILLERVL